MKTQVKIVLAAAVVFAVCLSLTVAAGNAPAKDQPAAVKKVLVVTGIDYPGHKWKLTTPVLVKGIAADKRLKVTVTEDPKFLASEKINNYDAVVLHFMDWEKPDPGPEARANLKKFVEGGKGLVVVHFACGAFQDWPEFKNLAGRAWDPKLRGHDPYGKFKVEFTKAGKSHPVTKGMKDFETTDELYTCLAGDRKIELLATAKSKVDGKLYPMAFAFDYGKGRVFHSPLGHDPQAFANPHVAQLFRRATAWAVQLEPVATKKETLKERTQTK
jgi:type 1 glutamine amidotransferase